MNYDTDRLTIPKASFNITHNIKVYDRFLRRSDVLNFLGRDYATFVSITAVDLVTNEQISLPIVDNRATFVNAPFPTANDFDFIIDFYVGVKVDTALLDSMNGCSLYINDELAVIGSLLKHGDLLKIVANDGYVFFDVPPDNETSVSMNNPYYYQPWFFELSEDKKTATVLFDKYLGYTDITFTVNTKVDSPDMVRGVNDVWLLEPEQVKEITQATFEDYIDDLKVNYKPFILGLIELPFKIDPLLVTDKRNIYLGRFDTGIVADSLYSDTIRLNLGVISVPSANGNLLDYKNTIALLHLPYAKTITLEVDYVIDQTISIEYLISLYDGTAVINVSSTKSNGVIYTQNANLRVSIPFGADTSYPKNNDPKNMVIGGDNGIKTPYIELLRSNAVLEDGFFTIPIIDESTLIEQSGFIKVDEVRLICKATSYEKAMILNSLKDGVIIK